MTKERGRVAGWKITMPPKRKYKPVRLRFQDSYGTIYHGNFFWCDSENTWLESDDEEGIGLYEADGYKVLGWKEARE